LPSSSVKKKRSLLYAPREAWRLSPAYDLTYPTGPSAEHDLAVNRRGREITNADVLAVARRQAIDPKRAASIIDEVDRALPTLRSIARDNGVSKATLSEVRDALEAQRKLAATA
jgi:serine/threonine-protein kinase HipA